MFPSGRDSDHGRQNGRNGLSNFAVFGLLIPVAERSRRIEGSAPSAVTRHKARGNRGPMPNSRR